MSNLDHEKLKEASIQKLIEDNKARDRSEAEKMYQEKYDEIKKKMWILGPEAIIRNIATELGIQVIADEDVAEDLTNRTIASLEIPEFDLIITAKVRKITIRKVSQDKKVADLTLSDGTGNTRLSLWEEEAEAVENGEISEGDVIRVYGAYTAEGFGQTCDIKKARNGKIEVVTDEEFTFPETEPIPISDLRDGMTGVSVIAKVSKIWEVKQTKSGKDYINLGVSDKDGKGITLKVWREDLVGMAVGPRLNEGDILTLTDLRVSSWNNRLSLNTTELTEFRFNEEEDAEEYPEVAYIGTGEAVPKDLIMAKDGDRIQFVGKIVRVFPTKPYYDSCPNPDCMKGVKEKEDKTGLYCPAGCPQAELEPPVPVARMSGIISDGTAALRFTAMREAAEKIISIEAPKIKEEFDELYATSTETEAWKKGQDASKVFVDAFSEMMLRGFVKVTASAKIDTDYRGNLELMINSLEKLKYEDEADALRIQIAEALTET